MPTQPFRLIVALGGLLLCSAYSQGHEAAPYSGMADAGDKPIPNLDPCATPNKGCACDTTDAVVDCGQVERISGDYVSCTMGTRTCIDGKWGECIGDRIATMNLSPAGQRTQGLGTTQACTDNPCDPYCQRIVDDSKGLDLPDGGPLITDGGLTLRPNVPLPIGSSCTGLVMTPTSQSVTIGALNSAFVKAEYFNQFSKTITSIPSTWTVTASRNEPNIDYDWNSSAPGPAGVPAAGWSARWTGTVIPTTTEAYTFYTVTDDGGRLWINGTLVDDHWIDQGATEWASTPVNLTAGVPATFRFEYYQNGGGDSARLRWSSPTIAKQAIPAANMAAPDGTRSRLTVTPANPTFSATLVPAGCFPGVLNLAWTLDRYDVAAVNNGAISLVSAVPGTLNVTAYAGQFSATGQLKVTVNATDSSTAPANAVTNFAKAAAGSDPMTILYPYNNTVLPTGLAAPRIMWDTGGTAASAVQVSLRYPASGSPSFSWNEIIPESNPPLATIPQSVWKDFENTGKGQDVQFKVQRLIGTAPAPALSRTLHFSTAPVRGLIYYTQYNRGGSTNMMVADPSSADPAHSAFTTVNGCPVCHSVSANGNYFATSDQSWSTNGGLSQVQAGGVLNPLADFIAARTPYTNGSNDWRGFAWAPLTPDGTYALSANNIYGNTKQSVVGIDTLNRVVSVPTTIQSGGTGTGLLAKYFPNTTFTTASPLWKRIDPIVNFDFGTGSPGGMVPVNYSVRRTGQIQAFSSETYTFQIDTTDGVRLTINGSVVIDQLGYQGASGAAPTSFTGSIPMTAGSKVSIQLDQVDTANESSIKLWWKSATVPQMIVPESQLYPNDGIHGLSVSYYSNNNYSGSPTLQRLEPDIYANWGSASPAAESALPVDNFSDIWLGQIESPYTGNVVFCVDADEYVTVTVNGVAVITRTSATSSNFCSGNVALVQGTLYSLRIDHVEKTSTALLKLRWQYGSVTERVPTANLYAPATYTVPTSGLTASYYTDQTYNSSLAANPTLQASFTRYDANINDNWNSGRTEYSQMTSTSNYSARWTGLLSAPCNGVYEFQTSGSVDEGGRLWLDQTRIANTTSAGALYGATYLSAGDHSFKFDYFQATGSAQVLLQWKVNCAAAAWATIPQSAFKPTGDTNQSGTMRSGGDNGNNSSYVVWQTPQTSGASPVDVSTATPGVWGLGGTAMMVPSFSPDGKKLVFIDGDSSAGAGWRKGLSIFAFDQVGKVFANRRSLVNTWPFGDALKWPTFESDSRSIIYQSTVPADMCCRNGWTLYGYMGPTNYYEDPGKLWSVDSQAATPTPVALTALNTGERAVDANKSYQATMSPSAAGGYRWVVFTSTRPYGNQFNTAAVSSDYSNTSSYSPMLNYTQLQSQLWVAAVDDTPSGTIDRSHPGFWLPNQNYAAQANAGSGYINERGFWVLNGCHANGTGSANTCEVDEDCCGGLASPKTALCRIDTPLTDPPTRHCGAAPPVGMCVDQGGVCSTGLDCCLPSVCLTGVCTPPPPLLTLGPTNYERKYTATCGTGTKPVWRFFDWETITPPTGSKLEFYAQTSATGTNFSTLPAAPAMITTGAGTGIVYIGSATGAPNTTWIGGDVGAALVAAGLKSQQFLKITIRFIPNNELTAAPTLTNWRQNYSCVPAE